MARAARVIGESAALDEGGEGLRFDWAPGGGEGKGFAVRYDGVVRAFVNRCPHLGVELDWQPGRFFEESGLYLTCSTHGAVFEPAGGLCVGGPCRGARLQAIGVRELDGRILVDDERTATVSPEAIPEDP